MTATIQEAINPATLAHDSVEVSRMYNTTVKNAITNFETLVWQALNENEIFNVATDNGNIIMLSENLYQDLLLTIEVNSNPSFKDTLSNEMNRPLCDYVSESEVEW